MRKEEKLLDIIGEINEELVPDLAAENESAKAPVSKQKEGNKNHRVLWLSITAGVLAAALLLYVIYPYTFGKKKKNQNNGEEHMQVYAMASPKMPEMPQSPELSSEYSADAFKEYKNYLADLRNQPEGYQDGYDAYCMDVLPTIFENVGEQNLVFSPLSLYMTLSMTSEITDGQTRQQILTLLHQPDIATARSHAKSIWLANYMDDGLSKLVLGNSLWTNSNWEYNQDVMDILASEYFAYSYRGDPSTEEYRKLLGEWINLMTDNMLEEQVSSLELDPDMVLALASTVNYSGKWALPFNESQTKPGTFHAPSGDVTCDFMYTEDAYENYYGEHFTCVAERTLGNGSVRFILPEEGMTPEALLHDEELLQFLTSTEWEKQVDTYGIRLTVPKFDISSDIKLNDYLTALGITDMFDSASADFSPLCSQGKGVHITNIVQDTRVMIDEEGCKAASMTIEVAGAGAIKLDMELVLDRPFLFEIVSETGLPLFVGIVNCPS